MGANELDFFTVDNKYYGGDQYWNTNWIMKHGGCSTATACETCIWLAKRGLAPDLYGFDPCSVSRSDFLTHFSQVFRYVHPGAMGLTSIEAYARMVKNFGQSRGVQLTAELLDGSAPVSVAAAFVKRSIDLGYTVSYLMLKHRDPDFQDFEWHWFTITGYRESDAGMLLTAATYGEKHELALRKAWHTGHARTGGLVCVRPGNTRGDLESRFGAADARVL